jgi:TonB family protein
MKPDIEGIKGIDHMDFKDQEPKEAMTDEQLSALLRKWDVEGAPAHLETRVFAARGTLNGSRRGWMLIPAIACASAFVLGAGLWLIRPRPAPLVPVTTVVVTQPQAAPAETQVVVNGPGSTAPVQPIPALGAQPNEIAPPRYAPAHVDFFSDLLVDSGQASPFAAKPAPEPAPQPAPQQAQNNPPLPAGVYRPGNGVTAPGLVSKREPEYSEEARIARLGGAAMIQLVVGEDGTGRNMKVTQPLGLGLDEKAIEAVKAWTFKPGVKDGAAVPVLANIQINFRLLDDPAAAQPWHLTRALFTPAAGAVRPVLLQAPYPTDSGNPDNDSVRISFDVDENGVPINFHSPSAANPRLEAEAIGILSGWRFRPGTSSSKPVSTPATFDFAHVTSTQTTPAGPVEGPTISADAATAARNLIDKTTPVYPREAKAARVQGKVSLQVHIGKDGHVVSASVISGDPLLTPAALEAVRQWLYRPTLMNGVPVDVNTQVDVNFTLSQ